MPVCIFDFGIKLYARTTIPRISHTRTRTSLLFTTAHNKYSAEDSSLIADLIKLSNKHPKLVKSTKHVTPFDPNIYLWSWKMNEYKYHDIPQARWRVELPEGMGRRHIVMSFRL